MSRNNRYRGNRGNFNKNHQKDKKVDIPSDDDHPVIKSFRQYALELDDKHDRYERILKQSRDITIESKRLIFLLHTADQRKANFDGILGDAKTRLESLVQNNFANIAKELRDQDHYQFSRAYSPGLQEFVEALTYYFYMSGDKWENWYDLQARLTYQNTVTEAVANDDADELLTAVNKILLSSGETKMASETIEKKSSPAVLATVTDTCLVQPIEFFLGLADLGGELMRRCINSLGCGDVDVCMNASKFLQGLYTCYLSLGNTRNKEMGRKIHTLRQSVLKAENVCYNIKVRGGEAAVWGSDDPLDKAAADDDEGFANY